MPDALETAASNPAKRADLEKRSFHSYTSVEVDTGVVNLDDIWFTLINKKPIIKTKVDAELLKPTDERIFTKALVRLLCASVLRVMQNPEGVFEEEGDDYRYRRDAAISTGQLYISDSELADLLPDSGGTGAWTIRPAGRVGVRPPLQEDDFYDPLVI